jgi:hypothetical protein
MATEPITLFARIADPAGVARRVREVAPKVEINGSDTDWRSVIITFGKGKHKQTLTLNHDPAYYSEPNWSSQMKGMRGYFSQFPDTDRKARVTIVGQSGSSRSAPAHRSTESRSLQRIPSPRPPITVRWRGCHPSRGTGSRPRHSL